MIARCMVSARAGLLALLVLLAGLGAAAALPTAGGVAEPGVWECWCPDCADAAYRDLHDVALATPDHGWAVGDAGALLRWDGVRWRAVPAPTANALLGLSLLSDGTGWAVGERGTVLRLADGVWTEAGAGIDARLTAVHAVSAASAWSVGGAGDPAHAVILRWDGAAWESQELTDVPALAAVFMLGPDAGWAVGGSAMLHWDGETWTPVDGPADGGSWSGLTDIAMVSATDGWAVGHQPSPARGGAGPVAYRYDGASWQAVALEGDFTSSTVDLHAVAMAGADDGWIVGRRSFRTLGAQPLAFHWDGVAWAPASMLADHAGFRPSAVAARASGRPWAVGNLGTVLRWDGSSFVAVEGSDQPLAAVSVLATDDAWAGGPGTGLLHWDGAAWSVAPGSVGLTVLDIALLSPTAGWAATADGLWQWNGRAWTASQAPAHFYPALDMVAPDRGWAVASPDTGPSVVYAYDGVSWRPDLTAPAIRDIGFTRSAVEGWAVGGSVHRWRDGAWADLDAAAGGLLAVFAPAADSAWAVGPAGIHRWDGAAWELSLGLEPAGGAILQTVQAPSTAEAWAGGRAADGRGLILHWDGASWAERAAIYGGCRAGVSAIHVLADGAGWAVGSARRYGAPPPPWEDLGPRVMLRYRAGGEPGPPPAYLPLARRANGP